ncbi:RND family efflux transporter MFP subunit [Enterobacter hormaechei]|nr:RND family efflux transporter MFP subunit [Enterobacter hormaechei]
MSLQKTWGNFHLSAMGVVLLSALLVGCDDSVAQMPRRKRPLSALLTWW